jgi:hypothetical protein
MTNPADSDPKPTLARHLPDDLRSSEAVRALLSDPISTTTALITAALASGRQDVVLAGGRVVQAVLKGRAYQQLGQELGELLKKGKIRKDYAETKYGFQSLVELMTLIDSEAPDEDKLRAAKAMFIAVNSADSLEGEAFLRYQLFRIALKLSGSQLVLLGICQKLHKSRTFNQSTAPVAQNWLSVVANQIGHRVLTLIERDETALVDYGLITPRLLADRSGVNLDSARLTDLGLSIGELIESYSGEVASSQARKAQVA